MFKNRSLHGLRGFAVLMVFFFHVQRAAITGGFDYPFDENGGLFRTLELGRLGVDLFFMISGYLIVSSLIRHRNVGEFLVARGKRIYPAFLVPHLLIFTVGPMIGYSWLGEVDSIGWCVHFFSNLLMLPGVFPLPIAQLVAWSLSFEMAFYVLAAGFFMSTESRRPTWLRALLLTGCSIGSAAILWQHPRAWFLVVGVAIYWTERYWPSWFTSRPSVGLAALAGMLFIYDEAVWLAVPCGLLAFATLTRQTGWLAMLLQARSLQYLGDISYSFYLWHTLAMFPLKRLIARFDPSFAGLLAFTAASFIASLIVSHLSYRWIEQGGARRRRPHIVPFDPYQRELMTAFEQRRAA
jgi:peptidoglycan/LPS O-acetylase OafA/YrhL